MDRHINELDVLLSHHQEEEQATKNTNTEWLLEMLYKELKTIKGERENDRQKIEKLVGVSRN